MKVLAEEKARLQEQLTEHREVINLMRKDIDEQTKETKQVAHGIELLSLDLNKAKRENDVAGKENDQFMAENEKISKGIPELKGYIETMRQKIQLNEMLKEVDIDELKMLKQNNMSVNSAIVNLVSRWEALDNPNNSKT